jgi:diguanylate cyclase (GGDEF)-like protein/PAS domain S-box-containing protein
MVARNAASKAASPAAPRPRRRPKPADAQNLAGALAVLESHRRDRLLEAVAMAAQELLRSSELTVALSKVMERIGIASDVDRAHIFLVDSAMGNGDIRQHHVWAAPGVPTPPEFRKPSRPLADVGLKSWIPRLERGETIAGHVRDFEPEARALFDIGGVKSTLCVPIFADGRWVGLFGFDDCGSERDWSAADIDTIKTMAELVGAAAARAARVKKLADANRIIENSPTILFRVGPRPPFPLTFLSQNVSRYGYSADALLTQPDNWTRLIDPADAGAMLDGLRAIAAGKADSAHSEFRLRKPDGTCVWFDSRASALFDGGKTLVAIEGILTDVTDRKLAAEKITKMARTDSLTGLANRAAFVERLTLEFARVRRGGTGFAVHYIDLDHFKDVNDTLGHPVGDLLLQAVAERLRTCVRDTDMVARFGGDEFAVLQDEMADVANVEALASKIGEAIARPFDIAGNQIRTSASIGVVPYRSDLANADVMMVKADLALYRAKNEGRNQFRFHVAELDERTRERMIVGEDLRYAIERGEFELYYQPQVDLDSGWIVGLEALLRWNHPKRGVLLPPAFIPIAETNGSMVTIGEWVIEQTCRQIRDWTDRRIAPPIVSVNLSGVQFKLAAQIDRIVTKNLARYRVAPEHLELELTESVLLETAQRYSEAFDRLRQIGVRLAIDDFGTGYSSLGYLRAFHVSRLKIDRRFIVNAASNADDAAIVRATIGLAHALGIEVVAEGVETEEQRGFLLSAGCTLAQGHFCGRPMPAAEVSGLLRHNLQFAAI